MALSEAQLETWSHEGATVTAKSTADSLRGVLNSIPNWLSSSSYEVYLQGSYKNTTNIYGDSDVDIVIQLNKTFNHDLSKISESEQKLFHSHFSNATYTLKEFKLEVLEHLKNHYGWQNVTEGNKCIKISGDKNSNRLPADVLVCKQYRIYKSFKGSFDTENYIPGVVFYTKDEERKITNFPKVHYDNGVRKMNNTSNYFKSSVRIFKNARSSMVDKRIITKELAPSYFVECMLYNIENTAFNSTTYKERITKLLQFLLKSDLKKFYCQNEQFWLFGDSEEQWNIANAEYFLQKFTDLFVGN